MIAHIQSMLTSFPAYPSCIVPLSFQLHADLAAQHDGANRWGYRRIHCARVGARGQSASASASPPALSTSPSGSRGQMVLQDVPHDLDWLYVENVNTYRLVGTPENTAQVTPYEFTTAMAEMAVEGGANVVLGLVTTINEEKGKVCSVTYTAKEGGSNSSESKTLRATDVVICAGPWTSKIYPAAPIVGLRQNSVIISTSRPRSAYMLFTEISVPTTGTQRSQHVTPEIFTRPNNTVWAAGDTDTDNDQHQPLPRTADDIVPDFEACKNIIAHAGAIAEELRVGEVLAQQACYLPNIEGDVPGPILGPTDVERVWIAAGHSCWGIQNAPGTGKIMSEFVYEGSAKSADVRELSIKLLGT